MEITDVLRIQNNLIDSFEQTPDLQKLRKMNEEMIERIAFEKEYRFMFDEPIMRAIAKAGFRYRGIFHAVKGEYVYKNEKINGAHWITLRSNDDWSRAWIEYFHKVELDGYAEKFEETKTVDSNLLTYDFICELIDEYNFFLNRTTLEAISNRNRKVAEQPNPLPPKRKWYQRN